jgi:predicted methyltransferase
MGDTAAQKRGYEKIGESDRMTLKFVKPAGGTE